MPPAVTVKVPPAADADPASAGLPMSRPVHGAGSVVVVSISPSLTWPSLTWRLVNFAVKSAESMRLDTASPTYAAAAMLTVAVPAGVQDVPFEEK